MTVLAHVAGVPVEETLLMLAPAILVAGGAMTARVRHAWRPRPRHDTSDARSPTHRA